MNTGKLYEINSEIPFNIGGLLGNAVFKFNLLDGEPTIGKGSKSFVFVVKNLSKV